MSDVLNCRNEFLFLYDIKNGNPNGDPDENRPRIDDVSKRCYVTDVRLKRFVRDYLIQKNGEDSVLVTKVGTKTVNLTDRVKERLKEKGEDEIKGEALMETLKKSFIDLRMFGSPLAFKSPPDNWGETGTITGPIQINFGETLHQVEEITFHGTSIFRSKGAAEESEQKQGTFTTYYAIPYGLIAFHGVANENASKTTGMTQEDYDTFKNALWKGVREASSAHTRTKREQNPRLLLNIVYRDTIKISEDGQEIEEPTEYHIGSLEDKVDLMPIPEVKEETSIRKMSEYQLDWTKLTAALERAKNKIRCIEYCVEPEFKELFCIELISKLEDMLGKENIIDLNCDRLSE